MKSTNFSHFSRAPHAATSRVSARQTRRGGQVLVYVSLIMVTLLGVCAIVMDEGYWFYRKAEMQKATDAAAMAGAGAIISGDEATAESRAKAEALRYAKANGYDAAVANVTVNPTNDAVAKKFRVVISSPYPTFFGSIFGTRQVNITTDAEATYDRPSEGLIPITGSKYGVNTGPINIGVYGPEQITNRGDLYSARYTLDNGVVTTNKKHRPDGYSFAVTLDSTFPASLATLQLYDADSLASGADATADSKVWDEDNKDQYGPQGANGATIIGRNATTITRYTLYSDNGTPFDPTDDGAPIATKDIGADSAYDRQWKDTFTWNPATYRTSKLNANFRLQVQTVAGSNENGFNVRVTRPGDTNATFENGGNGSNVSAIGKIPVNFGKTDTGEVSLGYVPRGATEVRIEHFDSDVGVTAGARIQYFYTDNNGGTSQIYPGNPLLGPSADNKTEIDTIKLTNFPGGTWKAIYSAGGSDNTTWELFYNGAAKGTIRLTK